MTSISITTLRARKRAVSERFGRAATRYETADDVQSVCASMLMLVWSSRWKLVGDTALDLGCATAPQARAQRTRWPDCHWVGADLSPAMLEQARKLGRAEKHYSLLCADAERLPLAADSQALVFSNFALQWCRPRRVAEELARVLMPGGALLLCVPLAGSLQELADSWAAADGHTHVNPLPTEADWRRALTGAGLEPLMWRVGMVFDYYPDVKSLTRTLQDSGVGHVSNRSRGLTGKSAWAAMAKAYEQYREEDGLRMTWRVLFAHMVKPSSENQYH